jgi:hypothetical protein
MRMAAKPQRMLSFQKTELSQITGMTYRGSTPSYNILAPFYNLLNLGGGTKAASFPIRSSGSKITCEVPSLQRRENP